MNDRILSLKDLRKGISQFASLFTNTELEGKGTLELDDKEVDVFGSPLAKITMKLTDWDREGYTKGTKVISQIGDAMGSIRVSEISPPSGDDLGIHPSGATAMAKNPDEGVCDENLKVFGLDNLYLVSNSVFPHMGANVPTLTIAALALRLGAHLERSK